MYSAVIWYASRFVASKAPNSDSSRADQELSHSNSQDGVVQANPKLDMQVSSERRCGEFRPRTVVCANLLMDASSFLLF